MYIVFEGPDGSGKSTIKEMVVGRIKSDWKNFEKQGVTEWHDFHQPGSTELGEQLRTLCKDKALKASGESQFYMTVADHYQFVYEHIAPVKNILHAQSCLFLQDRHSAISGYAYQVAGNDVAWIKYYEAHNQLLVDFPESEPDLVLLFQPKLKTILKRIKGRGGKVDRYEGEGFLKKVISGYKQVPAEGIFDHSRYVIIPSDGTIAQQYKYVREAIKDTLHLDI